MQYLHLPQSPGHCPHYEHFRTVCLAEKLTRDQLAVLLDEFVERLDLLLAEGQSSGLSDFIHRLPLMLLAEFLQLSGDKVNPTCLFRWLGAAAAAADWAEALHPGQTECQQVRQWLENHPDTWKALFIMGFKGCVKRSECGERTEILHCLGREEHSRLLGATRPPDYGLWCTEQAILAEDTSVAEWLLGETVAYLRTPYFCEGLSPEEDFSREVVSRRLAEYPNLKEVFDRIYSGA